jgi:hypothetical protein
MVGGMAEELRNASALRGGEAAAARLAGGGVGGLARRMSRGPLAAATSGWCAGKGGGTWARSGIILGLDLGQRATSLASNGGKLP